MLLFNRLLDQLVVGLSAVITQIASTLNSSVQRRRLFHHRFASLIRSCGHVGGAQSRVSAPLVSSRRLIISSESRNFLLKSESS